MRAFAIVLLIGAAAGCAQDGDVAVTLGDVADATTAAESARYSVSTESDRPVEDGPTHRTSGVFDFHRFDGSSEQPFEVRFVAATMFIALDDVATFVDEGSICYGRTWVVIAPGPVEGTDIEIGRGDLMPLPFDPSKLVAVLARSEAGVTAIGPEDVRSVPTTRYQVDATATDVDELVAGWEDELESWITESFDVWIDAEQRLRRASW